MKKRDVFSIAATILAVCTACTIEDDDRCPGGWYFVSELVVCCPVGESIFAQATNSCIVTKTGAEAVAAGCTQDEQYLSFKFTPSGSSDKREVQVCCAADTTHFFEGDSSCSAADVPVDTGSTDTDDTDGGPPSGLGESCTKDGTECATYDADFCAVNPLAPDDAYCTTTGCTAQEQCESGYACCDCKASIVLPQIEACLTDADAELATSMADCNCAI